MTEREIIEQLKSLKSHCEDFRDEEDSVWAKDVEALDSAIEALEKQVPKKTTYIHLNTRYTHWGRVRHDQFRCCNCGLTKEFVDGHASQYKFCPQCGLEIDWSDVDAD